MEARKMIGWDFPDLHKHHPDCSAVTPDQLLEIAHSRWPVSNGAAQIPYAFTTRPYNEKGYLGLLVKFFIYKFSPLQESNGLVRETLKAALNNWEKISGGSIQFYENTKAHFWSRGIFFALLPQATLDANDAGAMTRKVMDNNGELKNAYVFYPDTTTFWDLNSSSERYTAYVVNTYHHEIGHALGITDIYNYPAIEKQFSQIKDGLFCSVMPYVSHITTNTSQCVENCNPPYAVFPTTVDEAWLKLVYQNKMGTCRKFNPTAISSYVFNSIDAFVVGGASTFSHKFTASFLAHLAVKPNQPLLSPKAAYFIADSGMLAALIFLDMPVWPTCIYAVTSATKYLPDDVLNKIPGLLKELITSNYSVFLLNLSLNFLQGQCPVPLIISSITSLIGSLGGTMLATFTGPGFAWMVNKIPQAIYAKFYSAQSSRESDMAETLLTGENNSPGYRTMPVSSNSNSFFHLGSGLRHKIYSWFKSGDKRKEESVDIENQYSIHSP